MKDYARIIAIYFRFSRNIFFFVIELLWAELNFFQFLVKATRDFQYYQMYKKWKAK